jgi:hypothetical protein
VFIDPGTISFSRRNPLPVDSKKMQYLKNQLPVDSKKTAVLEKSASCR